MSLQGITRKLSSHALCVLVALRSKGMACDAVLTTEDGGEFQVHRLIMLACSPYFHALFAGSVSSVQRKNITLPGISAAMLKEVIEYAYGGEIKINWSNVYSLMEVSDQLNILGMFYKCCQFLMANLDCRNCIGIRKVTRRYFCDELHDYTERFLTSSFEQICRNSEFFQLNADEVCEILQMDNLNVKREEMVWEAGLSWVNHDPKNRSRDIAKIVMAVRFGFMDAKYFLEEVKVHPFITGNKACRPVIAEAVRSIFGLSINIGDMQGNKFQQPRIPYEIGFVFGGRNNSTTFDSIEVYDPKANTWNKMNIPMPCGPRIYHQCATVGYNIYIIGGYDGTEYLNTCHCFDTLSSIWTETCPMFSKRCHISVAIMENVIYAMGGNNAHRRLNSAERYFCDKNQWDMLPDMDSRRSDASATALKGLVYVAGGFDGMDVHNTVECYNPDTNSWSHISMRYKCSGLSCISLNGYLYLLGGFDGLKRLAKCEKFNPVTGTWTSLPAMFSARSNFATTVIDGLIFVNGGQNDYGELSTVECFNPKKGKWIKRAPMSLARSGASATVVKGLPNAKEYVQDIVGNSRSNTLKSIEQISTMLKKHRYNDSKIIGFYEREIKA